MTAGSDGAPAAPGNSSLRETAIEDMPQRLAEEARSFAEGRKHEGAERIGGMAQAIHSAADRIERELPQAAVYIHDAAARLQEASAMVRERSLEDLVGMVDDFARRQPAAFFGGSVVAGFLLARFLKSSNSRRSSAARVPGSDSPSSDFGGSTH